MSYFSGLDISIQEQEQTEAVETQILSQFAFKRPPLTEAETQELLEALQEDIKGISEWTDEEIANFERFMGAS